MMTVQFGSALLSRIWIHNSRQLWCLASDRIFLFRATTTAVVATIENKKFSTIIFFLMSFCCADVFGCLGMCCVAMEMIINFSVNDPCFFPFEQKIAIVFRFLHIQNTYYLLYFVYFLVLFAMETFINLFKSFTIKRNAKRGLTSIVSINFYRENRQQDLFSFQIENCYSQRNGI